MQLESSDDSTRLYVKAVPGFFTQYLAPSALLGYTSVHSHSLEFTWGLILPEEEGGSWISRPLRVVSIGIMPHFCLGLVACPGSRTWRARCCPWWGTPTAMCKRKITHGGGCHYSHLWDMQSATKSTRNVIINVLRRESFLKKAKIDLSFED